MKLTEARRIVEAARKPLRLSTTDTATMTPGQINKEYAKLGVMSSGFTKEFIAAGRGNERWSDIVVAAERGDPLAMDAIAVSDRMRELTGEAQRRAGPRGSIPLDKFFKKRR